MSDIRRKELTIFYKCDSDLCVVTESDRFKRLTNYTKREILSDAICRLEEKLDAICRDITKRGEDNGNLSLE